MTSPDDAPNSELVDVVAKALIALQPGNYVSQTIAQCYENAEAAVAAAEPLIRAAEKQRIVEAWGADGHAVRFNRAGDDLSPQNRIAKWLRNV